MREFQPIVWSPRLRNAWDRYKWRRCVHEAGHALALAPIAHHAEGINVSINFAEPRFNVFNFGFSLQWTGGRVNFTSQKQLHEYPERHAVRNMLASGLAAEALVIGRVSTSKSIHDLVQWQTTEPVLSWVKQIHLAARWLRPRDAVLRALAVRLWRGKPVLEDELREYWERSAKAGRA